MPAGAVSMASGMVSPPREDMMLPAGLRRLSESLTVLHPLPASGEAPGSAGAEAAASPPGSGKAP